MSPSGRVQASASVRARRQLQVVVVRGATSLEPVCVPSVVLDRIGGSCPQDLGTATATTITAMAPLGRHSNRILLVGPPGAQRRAGANHNRRTNQVSGRIVCILASPRRHKNVACKERASGDSPIGRGAHWCFMESRFMNHAGGCWCISSSWSPVTGPAESSRLAIRDKQTCRVSGLLWFVAANCRHSTLW